jgi:hypothetical protein
MLSRQFVDAAEFRSTLEIDKGPGFPHRRARPCATRRLRNGDRLLRFAYGRNRRLSRPARLGAEDSKKFAEPGEAAVAPPKMRLQHGRSPKTPFSGAFFNGARIDARPRKKACADSSLTLMKNQESAGGARG